MHIHTQQNKMFFCEVLATHQNQDDKFETNISILVGDCHIVATSNSCCVSVLHKHSTSVLLTRFRARLPYEDFRKKMLLTAQALPPAAGHPEVSGQTGLSLLLRRGRGERRWLLCSCRGAGRAGLGHQHPPAQRGARRAAPPGTGQPGPHVHICKSTVTSRLGIREEFPPSRASGSGVRGRKKRFWDWVQLYRLTAGDGSAWRPSCTVQACVPAELAIDYCCCHADQMLLWLHLLIPFVCACSEPCLCFQICSHCTEMTVRSM